MENLEKREYYSNLFDFYEELFTEKQRLYFKEYYFNDLSLKEIAENYHISRSAVYDQIVKVHELLDRYEESLKLYEKYQKRLEIYNKYAKYDNEIINELIDDLRRIE